MEEHKEDKAVTHTTLTLYITAFHTLDSSSNTVGVYYGVGYSSRTYLHPWDITPLANTSKSLKKTCKPYS